MRRFFLTVLIFAVVFVFCGCGGGGYPEIKIDAAKMANAIINGVDFESNMQQINKDSISAFIDLPGADPAYMFMGAGEKADSFGVFVFDSESDSKDGEKAMRVLFKNTGSAISISCESGGETVPVGEAPSDIVEARVFMTDAAVLYVFVK